MERLSGKIAIITGAGSGLGQEIARYYAREGAKLALADLTADRLMETEKLIKAENGAVEILKIGANVAISHDVQEMIRTTVDHFGTVDILVNNAGITGSQEASVAHTTPEEEWQKVMDINVTGVFLGSKYVLPVMMERGGGKIVNVASAAGLIAFPGRCAYTTSKGAVVMLTKSLALDYAKYNINVNAICPGMVETPMTKWRLDQPDLRREIEQKIPLQKVATPRQIAGAAVFLATDEADYITGHSMLIDGGWTTH